MAANGHGRYGRDLAAGVKTPGEFPEALIGFCAATQNRPLTPSVMVVPLMIVRAN